MTTLQNFVDEPELLLSGNVRAIEMPFNFNKAVHTWKPHGYSEVPLLVRAKDGKLYDDRKFKGIFKNGLYRKLVKRNYVVLPNEEVDNIVNRLLRTHGEKHQLYLFKTHFAYNGDAQYWEIRSKKEYKIPGSYRNNDVVQLGIIIRNSLGCNITYGMDVFTFCQVCANGAIRKGNDLLSMKIKHYGKDSLKMMTENLDRRMDDVMTEGKELIEQYEKAVKLKLRLETAKLIAKRIPVRYLPDYIHVDEKTKAVTLTDKVSLWNAFNDSTQKIWHNDISFLTKSDLTVHLHRVLEKEIVAR